MLLSYLFFFFNDTATTEIYTLSLHDALPISPIRRWSPSTARSRQGRSQLSKAAGGTLCDTRSEEHTSELQSPCNLVCRLLLEKKKYAKKTFDKAHLRHNNGQWYELRYA